MLDTARFSYFVAEKLAVPVGAVKTLTLGSHGDTMVPVPSACTVNGKPLADLLPADTIEELVVRTRNGGAEVVALLKSGSAYYAPSAAAARMAKAVAEDSGAVMPVCAWLDGPVRHQRRLPRRRGRARQGRRPQDRRARPHRDRGRRPQGGRRRGQGQGRGRRVALSRISRERRQRSSCRDLPCWAGPPRVVVRPSSGCACTRPASCRGATGSRGPGAPGRRSRGLRRARPTRRRRRPRPGRPPRRSASAGSPTPG